MMFFLVWEPIELTTMDKSSKTLSRDSMISWITIAIILAIIAVCVFWWISGYSYVLEPASGV